MNPLRLEVICSWIVERRSHRRIKAELLEWCDIVHGQIADPLHSDPYFVINWSDFLSNLAASNLANSSHSLFRPWGKLDHFLQKGEDTWGDTDAFVNFEQGAITFGLESGVDYDALAVPPTAELIEQQVSALLGRVSVLLKASREHGLLNDNTIPDLAIAVELHLDTPHSLKSAARVWAAEELRRLYRFSLRPGRQRSSAGENLSFAGRIQAPDFAVEGWAIPWTHCTWEETSGAWLAAHGGPRKLIINGAGREEDCEYITVDHVTWLKHGTSSDVTSDGYPIVARHRVELLKCLFAAAKADALRAKLHDRLSRREMATVIGGSLALTHSEYDLAVVEQLTANLSRYFLNARRALKSTGVEVRDGRISGIEEYFESIRSQLEVDLRRFRPHIETRGRELERWGGLLGWPGLLLSGAAIVLACVDTWWGVLSVLAADSAFDEGIGTKLKGLPTYWPSFAISISAIAAGCTLLLAGSARILRHSWRIVTYPTGFLTPNTMTYKVIQLVITIGIFLPIILLGGYLIYQGAMFMSRETP